MLYRGVATFSDHITLAFMFSPEVLMAELPKTMAQRLLH